MPIPTPTPTGRAVWITSFVEGSTGSDQRKGLKRQHLTTIRDPLIDLRLRRVFSAPRSPA